MADSSAWIVETPPADIQAGVIDRSHELPIILDFWAPWCQPCRTLGPTLEKLAREGNGRFLLMKVNVDEHQQLAAAFRVSSIPAVFALRDGQLVDQFVGVLSEDQIREWLAGFVPSEADDLLTQAAAAEDVDPVEAERLYRQVLEGEADSAPARIGLARTLVAQDRDDEAAAIIHELERRGFLETEAEQIRSQLEIRSSAAEAGDLADLRKAAAASPDDPALQLRLADTLAVNRKYTEAMELCLDLIRRDRAGIGDEARQTMVRIFDLIGPQSELVAQYRRKLATALY